MFTARSKPRRVPKVASATEYVLTLDQVDRRIGGQGRMPRDSTIMRESARLLDVMAGEGSQYFATLVCERGEQGARIAAGGDALLVARLLRSRAHMRGDEVWAQLLGERIRFRIVYRTAPEPAGRRRIARTAARTARLALA